MSLIALFLKWRDVHIFHQSSHIFVFNQTVFNCDVLLMDGLQILLCMWRWNDPAGHRSRRWPEPRHVWRRAAWVPAVEEGARGDRPRARGPTQERQRPVEESLGHGEDRSDVSQTPAPDFWFLFVRATNLRCFSLHLNLVWFLLSFVWFLHVKLPHTYINHSCLNHNGLILLCLTDTFRYLCFVYWSWAKRFKKSSVKETFDILWSFFSFQLN